MTEDRISNQNAASPEPSAVPIPPKSMDQLDDGRIANIVLWSERARKSAERPWWARLIKWLTTKIGGDYG
jgi:hypothetical protein